MYTRVLGSRFYVMSINRRWKLIVQTLLANPTPWLVKAITPILQSLNTSGMAAARSSSRFFRPLLYVTAAATAGGGILYVSYRPRNLPGSDPAAVPPPGYGEGGNFVPPRFPRVRNREEQIADLKQSAGIRNTVQKTKGAFQSLPGGDDVIAEQTEAEPYDLLVIGGGATGTGIALDAATRGLKVAVVERDDFGSGTSSKSTKLVHGGVRYLEKAVWELDYSQHVNATSSSMNREADAV